MRICIDIQSAVTQRAGVGRYARLLVEHLDKLRCTHDWRLFYFDFNRRGQAPAVPSARIMANRWMPGRLAQWAWKKLNWPPFDAFSGPADIFHFPNFIIPPLAHGRTVVNIHDMSFARFPEYAEDRNRRYLEARIADTARRADAIITGSRFTAAEICDMLKVDPSRVHAIHNGISETFTRPDDAHISAARRELRLDRPYLLTVGTIEPRKNLSFLVDVFDRLTSFDGELVLAGMLGWKCDPILAHWRASPRAHRIRHLEYVPDHLLPALYAGAELFILPSFYEGFGFPPLEAMACGTPVVSSSLGSLAEVLGDAAVFPGEFDADGWAAHIQELLPDTTRRNALTQAGMAKVKAYTWEQTAARTWAVYETVVAR